MVSTRLSFLRALRRAAWGCICATSAAALLAGCDDPAGPRDGPGRVSALAETIFGRGKVLWFTPDDVGAWTMHPLLDGPRVYFERNLPLSSSGAVVGTKELRALERTTGTLLWKGPIVSAKNAATAGDVVGAIWGSLPIFDRLTGARERIFRYGTTSLSSNVVSDGMRFYVGSHDGHVLAVDPLTGAAEWDRPLAGGQRTAVFGIALGDDALAVTLKHFRTPETPSDSGIVAVLDRATGTPRWRVALAAPTSTGYGAISDAPVITNGLVIVVTERHDVHAFDLGSGAPRWRKSVSFSTVPYGSNGLSACDGMVVVATGDLGVIALDAETGATRWRLTDIGDGSLRRLECSHGTVLVLGSSMLVLDSRTGALRARYPENEPYDRGREFFITSATRDEESLYVGTTFGYARVRVP